MVRGKDESNRNDECLQGWRVLLPHICAERHDAEVGHPAFF